MPSYNRKVKRRQSKRNRRSNRRQILDTVADLYRRPFWRRKKEDQPKPFSSEKDLEE